MSGVGETHRVLLNRLAHVEGFLLADATHFLQLEDPKISRGLADALADFLDRHPIRDSAA